MKQLFELLHTKGRVVSGMDVWASWLLITFTDETWVIFQDRAGGGVELVKEPFDFQKLLGVKIPQEWTQEYIEKQMKDKGMVEAMPGYFVPPEVAARPTQVVVDQEKMEAYFKAFPNENNSLPSSL